MHMGAEIAPFPAAPATEPPFPAYGQARVWLSSDFSFSTH